MKDVNPNVQSLLRKLQERSKELTCLYKVEEILNRCDLSFHQVFNRLIKVIPSGWQYPDLAQVKIQYRDQEFSSENYIEQDIRQEVMIKVQDHVVGTISITYNPLPGKAVQSLFLEEELKLLNSIADRIGFIILHQELKDFYTEWEQAEIKINQKSEDEWKIILNMLKRSDKNLYISISRKMLHFLSCHNIPKANELLRQSGTSRLPGSSQDPEDMNRPVKKQDLDYFIKIGGQIFEIAARNLHSRQILTVIQKWMDEEKVKFLTRTLELYNSSMDEIIDALNRFQHIGMKETEIPKSLQKGMRVSLVRRFFSDQIEFIQIAKKNLSIESYFALTKNIIYPKNSYGKLGGKSAGLFLASQIIKKYSKEHPLLTGIKTPKSWYINSDGLINFIYYNNLENIMEQKYKELDEISVEYPNIIQIFKHSQFPQEILKGLQMALDDFGKTPIIVRSSSLLEDRLGSSFSGKYKSLFLANQGSREERLEALTDAVAEVYASIFDADPIEYRSERGLLDFHEEMGIMIQEVVGNRVGPYFIPSFAGVAFRNNEFRWSSRINREDGLIRMVPGLGTRAVDRMADDYPVLIAPGKPDLQVNLSADETVKYAPKEIDVINLETNTFQTIKINTLLKEIGHDIPGIENMVSIYDGDMIMPATNRFSLDFDRDNTVITFEGLISRTDFVKRMESLLTVLSEELRTPVDVEFAHDGKQFYLLQCRPQSYTRDTAPAPIPQDVPREDTLFTANRYISNGILPNITHLVYVDPEGYNQIENLEELKNVGRAVGKLNKILPKHQFVLIGPGRWGSRGDIKLGVSVKYSDINNTAALIEVAFKKGNYTPELSFGTHFFQDLVESRIRYLPLFPDEPGILYRNTFFSHSQNILSDVLPDYAYLKNTVKVIDIQQATKGKVLKIVMNADLDSAIGYFTEPTPPSADDVPPPDFPEEKQWDDFWRWRKNMAEQLARELDPEKYGIKGFYLIGSVKNATAGPGSDIDLLVHHQATEKQLKELKLWLDGWSKCLAEINRQRTGYQSSGLLDVHYITDQDIKKKTSYAVKINAVTDPAKPLVMGSAKA